MTKDEIMKLSAASLREGYKEYLEKTGLYPSTVKASCYSALFLFRYDKDIFWDIVFSSDDVFRDKAKDAIREAVKAKGLVWKDEHSVISRVYHLSNFRAYVNSSLLDM